MDRAIRALQNSWPHGESAGYLTMEHACVGIGNLFRIWLIFISDRRARFRDICTIGHHVSPGSMADHGSLP
jgi:hypothetical protein